MLRCYKYIYSLIVSKKKFPFPRKELEKICEKINGMQQSQDERQTGVMEIEIQDTMMSQSDNEIESKPSTAVKNEENFEVLKKFSNKVNTKKTEIGLVNLIANLGITKKHILTTQARSRSKIGKSSLKNKFVSLKSKLKGQKQHSLKYSILKNIRLKSTHSKKW